MTITRLVPLLLLAGCATAGPDPMLLDAAAMARQAAETLEVPGAFVVAWGRAGNAPAAAVPGMIVLRRDYWAEADPALRAMMIAHETGHVLAMGDGSPYRAGVLERLVAHFEVATVTRFAATSPDEAAAECAVMVLLSRAEHDARARCGELWRAIAVLSEAEGQL